MTTTTFKTLTEEENSRIDEIVEDVRATASYMSTRIESMSLSDLVAYAIVGLDLCKEALDIMEYNLYELDLTEDEAYNLAIIENYCDMFNDVIEKANLTKRALNFYL